MAIVLVFSHMIPRSRWTVVFIVLYICTHSIMQERGIAQKLVYVKKACVLLRVLNQCGHFVLDALVVQSCLVSADMSYRLCLDVEVDVPLRSNIFSLPNS